MAITMDEIAKKLNISIATVSRALSGNGEGVAEDTKEAIHEIAEKYGYQKRKSVGKNVAFVIDKNLFNLSSQFYTGIISGVEEELIKYKYYFQFNSVERENFKLDKINLNFSDLAGVILVGAYNEGFVLKLRELGLPMVLVDEYIPSEDIISVMIDNTDGILKACKYLCELKHKRVAYISEEKNEATAYERYYGFKQAQEMFGFVNDDKLITESSGKINDGFRAMERILEQNKVLPTAVLAYNDIIAIGAMDAIKQHGLSIPKDISVIGFDDVRLAREVVPALTTVHVPKHLMGIISVQRLINVIQGKKDIIKKVLVPTELKVRKSTALAKT